MASALPAFGPFHVFGKADQPWRKGGVFFVQASDGQKFVCKVTDRRKDAQREAANLRRLQHVKGVHHPVLIGETDGVLIESFVEGELFSTLRDLRPQEQLLPIYEQAIDTLACLHASIDEIPRARRLRSRFSERRFPDELAQWVATCRSVSDEAYRVLERIDLAQLVRDNVVVPHSCVMGHGDYKPDNLMVTDKGLVVIDWFELAPAQPWYDLAYLTRTLDDSSRERLLLRYVSAVHEQGCLLDVTPEIAFARLRNGRIVQELIRANSNAPHLHTGRSHHLEQFTSAIKGISSLLDYRPITRTPDWSKPSR